ncbi:MAG: hypothetical protein HOO00_01155 [Rhodospirillaceae bacterium]|nr:hypothetical protein [Rhodospirillaceae bacterium]
MFAVAILTLAGLMAGSEAWAGFSSPSETAAPRPLAPPKKKPEAMPSPRPLLLREKAPPVEEPHPDVPTPGAPVKIEMEVESLETIDPDSVGVLDENEGGFGADMWAATSRPLIEHLLPRLPVRTASMAKQDLIRRLLLSTASVPAGPASGPSLLSLRVERLMEMGNMAAVNELLRLARPQLTDETLLLAHLDNLLLVNDSAGACSQIRAVISQYQDIYWRRTLLFCQALSGEHERARLGLSLMRERGEEDPVFSSLIGALLGDWNGQIESLPDPTPLYMAMFRAAGLHLPNDVIAVSDPALLRAIAVYPHADIEIRLAAAERAEAAGILDTVALAQIYASLEFSAEELEKALTLSETYSGPRGRALLLRAAHLQGVPTAKAEVLLTLLERARKDDLYGPVTRLIQPLLENINPSSELIWFAEEAGRALIFVGRPGLAKSWLDLAEAEAKTLPEAAEAYVHLWILSKLADEYDSVTWNGEILESWLMGASPLSPWMAAEAVAPDDVEGDLVAATGTVQDQAQDEGIEKRPDPRLVAVVLSLFDALGEPVGIRHWQILVNNDLVETSTGGMSGKLPPPALFYGLRLASEELRLGETVLFALIVLGEEGLEEINPIILNDVINRMRLIGLDSEARSLAVEAAIRAGL